MIYKVVHGPKNVEGNACKYFEDIINENAKDGWRYHSMDTVLETKKPGCFLGQPTQTYIYMLIFEKDE